MVLAFCPCLSLQQGHGDGVGDSLPGGMFSTGHCLACPPLAHGREGPCLVSQGSPLPFKGAMDTQPGQVLLEGPGIKNLPLACVWWGQIGAGAGACAGFWLPAFTPFQRLRTSR